MSHLVQVNLIADQEIYIHGIKVNIHDIVSLIVDDSGNITDCLMKGNTDGDHAYTDGWLMLQGLKTE